jgi:hypothetical protein
MNSSNLIGTVLCWHGFHWHNVLKHKERMKEYIFKEII